MSFSVTVDVGREEGGMSEEEAPALVVGAGDILVVVCAVCPDSPLAWEKTVVGDGIEERLSWKYRQRWGSQSLICNRIGVVFEMRWAP